jgi:hypothetical protein
VAREDARPRSDAAAAATLAAEHGADQIYLSYLVRINRVDAHAGGQQLPRASKNNHGPQESYQTR